MLTVLYTICFGVGFLLALASFVLGEILDIGHVDIDGPGPFSGSVMSTFITGFGAGGLVVHKLLGWGTVPSLAGALVSGVALASVALVALKMLYRQGEVGGEFSLEEAVGSDAQVTVPIPADGKGQVSFVMRKSRQIAPAISADGKEIHNFKAVKILKIAGDTMVVEEIKEA